MRPIHSLKVLLEYNRKIENMTTRHFKVTIVDLILAKFFEDNMMDVIK